MLTGSYPLHAQHVWDASLALMASLCLKPKERLVQQNQAGKAAAGHLPQDLFVAERGCVSVELGTGTGLLSLWLDKICGSSALLPTSSTNAERKQSRRLFLTDLGE